PVGGPLPDVADHLPQPIAVRFEGAHGGGGEPAVFESVRAREDALPDVRSPTAVVDLLVAPRVLLLIQPAPRGIFPLGLGGQAPAGPPTVGLRIVPTDVHRGVIAQTLDARVSSARTTPVGAAHADPPRRLRR